MDNQKWTYKNQDTGEDENVVLENWIWAVLYKDGTELHQFDDNGVFHRIAEIEQEKAEHWVLYQPKGKGDGRITFIVPKDQEYALIHKYKNFVFNAGTQQEYRKRIHVFGFKIKGSKSVYNFVLPDNTIIQSIDANPQLAHFVQK